MAKIVIAGGGWSGIAAAVRAVKRGHETVLCEKTDMLLGLGNVGGIMRNNGRFTAAEENAALGAGELFAITDRLSTHRGVNFPKHDHASFYDVSFVEPEVRRLLAKLGVEMRFMTRIVDVEKSEVSNFVEPSAVPPAAGVSNFVEPAAETSATNGVSNFVEPPAASGVGGVSNFVEPSGTHGVGGVSNFVEPSGAHAAAGVSNFVESTVARPSGDMSNFVEPPPEDSPSAGVKIEAFITAGGERIEGDAFIETTGSTGPMGNCAGYGNGCSMCVLRCPSFGPRVSLTARAGASDLFACKEDGTRGAFSGSCKLEKRTLSPELQEKLAKDGVAVVPLPEELINREKLTRKVCRQYALDAYAENLILIDTGHAKLMTPYFDLASLRKVKGFENVRFIDPYAGGKGNSVRYMSVGVRDDFMRAKGFANMFLGGEKSGFFIGHTEAITTGSLAGYNASLACEGRNLLQLPETLAVGDLLQFAQDALREEDGLDRRFTFAGGEYFERMKERGLYSVDVGAIRERVALAGLAEVYNR